MKKSTLITTLFISVLTSAQITIVEEKIEKGNFPSFSLLEKTNQIIISKGGSSEGLSTRSMSNSLTSYSEMGNKKEILKDQQLLGTFFSSSENALLYVDISDGLYGAKCKYFIGDKTKILTKAELKESKIDILSGKTTFNSKFEYNLQNQKGNLDIDLKKDELNFVVTDIFTRKANTYKIEKPSLDKLIGENFIKPEEKLGCILVSNFDETVDLVTKSISKDYTKTILYKTRLSNEGKKVSDVAFEMTIPNQTFIYSFNNGGFITFGGYGGNFVHFFDDLWINNYIEDKTSGDIYIYGLFADKLSKLNSNANPKGYYVFKFDKTGKKLWESINKLDDNDFNKNHTMTTVFVDLFVLNNNICLNIQINGLGDFYNYNIIDKTNGKVTKTENIEINETFSKISSKADLFKINKKFKDFKEFKDKKFSFETLVAINSNSKIEDYVKKISSKNDLFFKSSFSDKGIWLYETDNKDYYKVTLFKE
jgi:hypothetical protein